MFESESVWEHATVDAVAFGEGAAAELPAHLPDGGPVLLVTDPGVREAGIVDHLVATLDDRPTVIFDGVDPDPALPVFVAAVERVRDCDPAAVVGVGGGSAIDVAKAASALAAGDGDVLDYVAPPTGAGDPVPDPGRPTVAVP
ncbi:MAG: iron-containing alcohol dehydrogenase, partial [Haloferacaceae archaeon]